MRPVPIPDEALMQARAKYGLEAVARVVIGEPGDVTREDIRPAEYLVIPSELYPGAPTFVAVIELDDTERAAIADGGRLALALEGGELPWSLWVTQGQDVDRG